MPAALTEPCQPPVEIPDRDLSTPETARLWGADRRALGDCRRRHAALAASAAALEGQGR
ncbi:MAG: hypothetical protein ACK4GT_00010 [Pararhodobacter sp.]